MCSAASMANTNRIARRKPIAARPAGCFTIAATGHSKTSPPPAEFSTAAPNRWALPCSMTTQTAGPICWWRTTRSPTSSIATSATAHSRIPRWKRAGLQQRRQGARGHGRGCRRFRRTPASPGVAITNFDNEMIGLYEFARQELRRRCGAGRGGLGVARTAWASAALFSMRISMAGWILPWPTATSTKPCATFAATSDTRSRRMLVSQQWQREAFATSPPKLAEDSISRKSDAAWPMADFDRDGDLDLLLTTNNGPAYLYRNDQLNGNRSIRFRLVGTKSNRDGIGATVRVAGGGLSQSRMVKSGSSYLVAI